MSRLKTMGGPSNFDCWVDESDNRPLKKKAAASHAIVFHARVLASTHAEAVRKRKDRVSATAN